MGRAMAIVAAGGALAALTALRGSAAPADDRCAKAAEELANLRRLIRDSPPAAMLALGARVDDFERIAQSLHARWLAAQPSPARTWWCYNDENWGDCSDTSEECVAAREKIAGGSANCARWSGSSPLEIDAHRECIRNAAFELQLTECTEQEHVACFRKHHVLQGVDSEDCMPSIKTCKGRRDKVIKQLSDDIKVTSNCQPR